MNWEAIGAIGEVLGAAVVVATLFYLSVQLRQNTKAQTIATFESAMAGFNDVNYFVFGDKERAGILLTGFRNPEELDEVDHAIFVGMVRSYSNHVYKLFRLYERGVFPEHEWVKAATEYKQAISTVGGERFRVGNRYFDDLWAALDDIEDGEFTDFGFELQNS